jgi:opacity protein-like surface antigen
MNRIALAFMIMLSCIMIFPAISGALDFQGIGGRVSGVFPKGDADTNFGLGAIIDLGPIASQWEPLKAEISANYWGSSYNTAGSLYKTDLTSVSFNGRAKLQFTLGGVIFPFIGGGLGVDIERWTIGQDSSGSVGSTSDSKTGLLTHLVAGIDIPLGSDFKFTPQAEYNMGRTDTFQVVGALVFMFK